MSARSANRTVCANVERAVRATSAATATGLSRRMHRSKKTMKASRLRETRNPDSVTPRSGTESSSIRRSTENENVRVPTRTASVVFNRRSRNQRRMMRAENVPVAICTTRTVTVTTKPVSAAVAPTIADSTVLAVDGEYCHRDVVPMCSSADEATIPRPAPSTAPSAGVSQRPSTRLSRRRNRRAQVMTSARPRRLSLA